MKICPNCKKQYADNVEVCPDDGTFLDFETPLSGTRTTDSAPRIAETVDRIGTSAAENFDRDTGFLGTGTETVADRVSPATLAQTDDSVGSDYTESPMFGWLVPLIIMLILIITGYMFCSKPAAPAAAITVIINNNQQLIL
jgi:hypothetical protein